jgi:hypothetical protein
VVVAQMADVRKTANGLVPVFVVDMVLRVLAPKSGEIQQSWSWSRPAFAEG